ncbi:hypothetical protein BDZ89DRAFT_1084852, partial [Hymenopellis radicata]
MHKPATTTTTTQGATIVAPAALTIVRQPVGCFCGLGFVLACCCWLCCWRYPQRMRTTTLRPGPQRRQLEDDAM